MARPREPVSLDCKVYVGELGNNGTRHELEDAFGYYGPLKEVWVARNPPGFAFVMYQDPRDARDAVRALDGKLICGRRVRVELSTGKSRHEKSSRGFDRGDRGGDRGGRDSMRGSRGSFGSPPPRDRGMPRREPYARGPERAGRYEDRGYPARHRAYSRSRSRSPSPMVRGRPRTPPSRSRSHSPMPKSPRSDRYD